MTCMNRSWSIWGPSARRAKPLFLGMLVASMATMTPAGAQSGQETMVQISAMLASKDQQEFDPRLTALRPELRGLPFKGYTLLAVQACRLEAGDQCEMDIPGGGYLHMTTTECTSRHLKIRLLLNQHNRPVINADIKLNRNAGILLKSARTEMGTIVLSIKTSSPAQADASTGSPGK